MENLHPVIKSILQRRDQPTPFSDRKKIGLVLFGGAMLGVGGGGAVSALEDLGLSEAFDEIYVVSAGLPNASYFLSKQTKIGTSIYYQDLNGRKFINLFKIWKVACTDVVVDVIRNIKPLDVRKVISSRTEILVRLYNLRARKTEYLNLKEVCRNENDYFGLLKSAITFIKSDNRVKINNEIYIDGSLPDFNYVKEHVDFAMSRACTDLLIVYPSEKYNLRVSSDTIYEIVLPVKMSNLETRGERLREAAYESATHVKKVFGSNEPVEIL